MYLHSASQDEIDFVLSDEASELMHSVVDLTIGATDVNRALNYLRKRTTSQYARLIWEMALLRRRGKYKFGDESFKMYFTRAGLEMASSAGPSAYHAQRLNGAGISLVIDLCCGIGGDAIAFARAGMSVIMVDIDPIHLAFAAANIKALGLTSLVTAVPGDASSPEFIASLGLTGKTTGVWFDPARRTLASKRTVRPEDYVPSLSLLTQLKDFNFKAIGVKLAPGIDHEVGDQYGAALEFLSHDGECKEALLWLGGPGVALPDTSAVLLKRDGIFRLQNASGTPSGDAASGSDIEQDSFLYEPDPAVIRSHLVKRLAQILSARLIDPQIAYLFGGRPVLTPYAECYPIIERFDYSRRALQGVIDRHNIGRLIVKKRGVPVEPEDVIKQVKLRSGDEFIVVITRQGDARIAFLCRKPLIHEAHEGLAS